MVDRSKILPYQRVYKGSFKGDNQKNRIGSKKKWFSLGLSEHTVISNIIAFMLGRAMILDSLTPFGIAYIASILPGQRKSAAVWVSTLLGILSVQKGLPMIRYVFILVLFYLLFTILSRMYSLNIFKTALLASFSVLSIGMFIVALTDFLLYDTLLVVFEAVITFVLIYIFKYAVPVMIEGKNRRILSNEELICATIMMSLVLIGLTNIKVYGYSLKNVLSVFLVLIFAYNSGGSVG